MVGEAPGERVVEEVAPQAGVGVADGSEVVEILRNEELERGCGRTDASPPVSERVSSPLPKFVTRLTEVRATCVLSTVALGSLPCAVLVISWWQRMSSKFPCACKRES